MPRLARGAGRRACAAARLLRQRGRDALQAQALRVAQVDGKLRGVARVSRRHGRVVAAVETPIVVEQGVTSAECGRCRRRQYQRQHEGRGAGHIGPLKAEGSTKSPERQNDRETMDAAIGIRTRYATYGTYLAGCPPKHSLSELYALCSMCYFAYQYFPVLFAHRGRFTHTQPAQGLLMVTDPSWRPPRRGPQTQTHRRHRRRARRSCRSAAPACLASRRKTR